MRMRRAAIALLIGLTTVGVSAHVELPASFKDIVAASALIVRGHVTDVRAVDTPEIGVESVATVAIDDVIKGSAGDAFVAVHVPGGVIGRYRYTMVGAPTLAPNEQAIFLLERRADNAWRLVSLTSALYVIHADARGRAVVIPPVLPAASRTGAGRPLVRGAADRRPMAVQDLEAMIRLIAVAPTGAAR
jgi:hypothetical protein